MNQNRFLFEDKEDGEMCLFFFKQVTDDVMKVILPTESDSKGDFFVAILKTGVDYLGKTEWSGIEKIKASEELVSLDESNETIKFHLKIDDESIEKYRKFCDEKLVAIADVESKLNE